MDALKAKTIVIAIDDWNDGQYGGRTQDLGVISTTL
jgi:hypothetical protein